MIPKILVAFFIVVVSVFGILQLWSNYSQKGRMRSGRVAIAIEEAKSKGRKSVQLPAPIPYYAAVSTLDEALEHYTTLIVRPVAQHSQLSLDSKEIETWYKFAIVDHLSQPKINSTCSLCPAAKDIPTELQPIGENEFILARNIGSVVLDGIAVKSADLMFPDFESNKEYLVFLSFDPRTRLGTIELGPAGVSVIQINGDMEPISDKNRKLRDELVSRYGNLKNIKAQLKFRRFPQ